MKNEDWNHLAETETKATVTREGWNKTLTFEWENGRTLTIHRTPEGLASFETHGDGTFYLTSAAADEIRRFLF
ncbi:hypothetical protein [Bifidobacterium miconisargentati]|uniref:hypothetical protein n=1 Tax=Bifidobacterium miconisargentati TaxID=2834437 RepID=UPI001BDCDF8C|nr:hypothetical protein [Bifidobacterium miconisargentati]MBW3090399.1 hypothetical protein [Bifidobacterium miconisargentati]